VIVGETQPLDAVEHPGLLDACHDLVFGRHQRSDAAQEPGIDRGQTEDLFEAPLPAQPLGDLPQPVRRWLGEAPLELGVVGASDLGRCLERVAVDLERPYGLVERLFEGSPHRRYLADRLHGRAEDWLSARELLECEARDLDNHVVEGRLEGGRSRAGDVVHDLVQASSEGDLGGDTGDREAGRLGGQGRRPRYPRVHLDDHVAAVGRVDRELDVGATGGHSDRIEDDPRRVAKHLKLAVGESLRRGHRDRVAGVDSHRVEVFNRANHHEGAHRVTHDLELELLPPQNRGLDQHLVGG